MSAAIQSGREHRGALSLDCDVVVVGSGAGGATVATELALAGKRVVVLEEGRNIPAHVHGAMRQSQSLRNVWREGGMTVAFGIGGAPTVNVTMGRVIGGSSVVTGGVCFRVNEHVLDRWSKDMRLSELTPAGVDAYYAHVEKALHVEDVPVEMRSRSTSLFAEGAEKLGYPLSPIRRNTSGCEGCGRCNFGCPHSAKLSVDLSYLPRAMAAGATVFSECIVDRVTIEHGRATGVVGRLLNGPLGARGDRLKVRAKKVVVAAGGVHSPALLAASGIGGIGSHVGANLTLHPGCRVFARFDEPVHGWAGAMQSAFSTAFEHEGVLLNSLFIPASVIAATMPGSGPRHARLAEQVGNIAMFGVQIHDDGGGFVVRSPFGREPLMLYRCSKHDHAALRRGIRIVGETFLAAGAKEIFLPVLGGEGLTPDEFRRYDLDAIPTVRLESASQHPLGTCRMSRTAADGVVDAYGRCWDVGDLYVADGSILPSSLGVNPQLTVMMMATRIAWHMAGN
jgi:choline dehydrogenase-like flavoprotein